MAVDINSWNCRLQTLIQKEQPQARWTLEWGENIQPDCLHPGWKQYQQRAFGRFKCSSCRRSWASAQVNVLCHMYLKCRNSQGLVLMRCFGQKCQNCSCSLFEKPHFSPESTGRILHNLAHRILEKFYGDGSRNVSEMPVNVEVHLDGSHDMDNCEACSLGFCVQRLEEDISTESAYSQFSYMEMGSNTTEGLRASYATSGSWVPNEGHRNNWETGQQHPPGAHQQGSCTTSQQSVLVARYLPSQLANSPVTQTHQEWQETYSSRMSAPDNALRYSSSNSPTQYGLSLWGCICAVALFTFLAVKYAN
ncbi:receptor-transporting protein 4 [Sorex fumeus]|uniref:receptor-transporting protein 4 n=1 Tax=Sorex fumeus TaxID=62283 RepID=UPI0024ACF5E9|nr:receptor-transporting protein 4 [Sorex fumeus]